MPTANKVDNRPVAVGKWPRNNNHIQHHPAGVDRFGHRHRRKCNVIDNCTHNLNLGNPCTDVLLNPELLNQIHGDRNFLSSSSNPLLEFCLDGGNLKNFNFVEVEALDPLLQACLDFTRSPLTTDLRRTLDHLGQIGCDINVRNSKGNTALHILLKGCTKEYFNIVFESTSILLGMGLDTSIQNDDGDDCLAALAHLLDKGLFSESFDLANILLEDPRSNPNSMNKSGRSLLTYSVIYGDESVDLTRLLLNHGAKVWPIRSSLLTTAREVTQERAASAFTHLLRSAMQRQDLTMFEETLKLICDDMGTEPEAMRTHVLGTMLHTGQALNGATNPTMANLFLQLKSYMSDYWRQPLSLRYLCVNTIRGSLGPRNIIKGAQQLKIPSSLICNLHLK